MRQNIFNVVQETGSRETRSSNLELLQGHEWYIHATTVSSLSSIMSELQGKSLLGFNVP